MKTITVNIIEADEGKMLYNGDIYSEKVYLGTLDKIENWQEVDYSQYEAYLKEQEEQAQATEP